MINQTSHHRNDRAGSTLARGNALAFAERSFQLLVSGPNPLAIDGRLIAGLPPRMVNLEELRTLLLDHHGHGPLKDTVWRELVRRACSGDPAWVVGCVGVAMPGLKNVAARIVRSSPSRHSDDLVSELLAEFVVQLSRVDTDRPFIAARLVLWARKGALRARGREMRHEPCAPQDVPAQPASYEPAPVELLLEAVRKEIITANAAEVIIATRLDGLTVQQIAGQQGAAARQLYKQRQRAETCLIDAIRDGQLHTPLP